MERKAYLLDTSALLSLIENEEGADRVKASHRLSLADAIIAAFALRQNAVLVHKDPEYEALAGEVELEALPYKPKQKS